MMPRAYIVHQSSSRVRLRIREKRQDSDYLDTVKQRMAQIDGVASVRVNFNTGTIVLLHPETTFQEISHELYQPDLFEFIPEHEPKSSALVSLRSGITKLNQVLSENTAGVADLKTLSVVVIVILAIHQIRRGNLLGPALPLLATALDLAVRLSPESTPDHSESVSSTDS